MAPTPGRFVATGVTLRELIKLAYPAGVNDAYRFTVNGGQNLDLRISTSTHLLQLGMEIEQARRNR